MDQNAPSLRPRRIFDQRLPTMSGECWSRKAMRGFKLWNLAYLADSRLGRGEV